MRITLIISYHDMLLLCNINRKFYMKIPYIFPKYKIIIFYNILKWIRFIM